MQTEQTTLSTQMIKLQKFILTKNNYSRRKINLNKFIFSKIGNLIWSLTANWNMSLSNSICRLKSLKYQQIRKKKSNLAATWWKFPKIPLALPPALVASPLKFYRKFSSISTINRCWKHLSSVKCGTMSYRHQTNSSIQLNSLCGWPGKQSWINWQENIATWW